MRVTVMTDSDLPEPGSTVKFKIKGTLKWRPGYTVLEGTDFVEEVRGITYKYSWNQIEEYAVMLPEAEA